jgi:hypothetical protein
LRKFLGVAGNELTKTYMHYLSTWARSLSWKEITIRFGTSWEKVFHSVQYIVDWELKNRVLSGIKAIGIDEILWHRGHKYLTLVYQIVSALNKAIDKVRAREHRQMKEDGHEPILKNSRWCLLKRKSHEKAGSKTERCAEVQPEKRESLSAQRGLSRFLGLRVTGVGGRIFRPVVDSCYGLENRTFEEGRKDDTKSSTADSELVQSQVRVLQRCCRGAKQQNKSHYEKIQWF